MRWKDDPCKHCSCVVRLTTQLQCLQGSSLHLIPVNTYNTATVFTGVISPPHSSEYLQHSYSVYRDHLSTSFQWILTTQLQCIQGSSLHLVTVNTYNTATVFTGIISPSHSSEYIQHSYSVYMGHLSTSSSEYLQHSYSAYRGHLSTSFQWILTTQLQCLHGSSFHLIPVNTYNTASVYRGNLFTSFQWILTTQLQCLQGSKDCSCVVSIHWNEVERRPL
jgi:thiamine kinase-like enzyme